MKKITIFIKDFYSATEILYSLTYEQLKNLSMIVEFNSVKYIVEFFKTTVDIVSCESKDVVYVSLRSWNIRQQFFKCLEFIFK